MARPPKLDDVGGQHSGRLVVGEKLDLTAVPLDVGRRRYFRTTGSSVGEHLPLDTR